MALYEAVITKPGDTTATIRCLRHFGDVSISQIQSAISAAKPVVAIASEDYSLELDFVSGRVFQNRRFVEIVDELIALGNALQLRYRPSRSDEYEIITPDSMRNLMRSELTSIQQEHD